MAIAPYIRRLRSMVGHELLVLPGAAVLPRDEKGRVLLVQIIETTQWAVIGGAIEPDESPQQAACREAAEEAGVIVRLDPILAVLGGPPFRVTYPNGDETSYVTTVFGAAVISGTPTPDGDETCAVQWWDPADLPYDEMSGFTRALLRETGVGSPSMPSGAS